MLDCDDRLSGLRRALRSLHWELLEVQRREIERSRGRMSPGEALQAAITDIRFAWPGPLTSLLAAEESGDPAALDSLQTAARALVAPPDPDAEFGRRYLRALQEEPAVVIAHRDVIALL